MDKVPRISVLMGIYNCAETLPMALDSLLSQTYPYFKIILCDDGSTDDTYLVAKRYAEENSHILLLKNEHNIKLAATLNKCLQYADTEYVARMDGDDISLPNRFAEQISFLDENSDFAIVSCPMIYFDELGDWGKGRIVATPTIETFKYGTPHAHAPSMMRTEVLKSVGGYTDKKEIVRVEDYFLWFKIYRAGYKGYNLKEYLYKMRDDRDAMSRRTFKNRYNAFLIKMRVLNDLGFKRSRLFYALPDLLKILLPPSLMAVIRKFRMR